MTARNKSLELAREGKQIYLEDLPQAIIDRALGLREAGFSYRNIGAELELSHGSVQRLLKAREATAPAKTIARMPSRPRNGQAALPDFEKLGRLTAKGKTVKEVWRTYARETPKAYCYTHFSTLFRVWLEHKRQEIAPLTLVSAGASTEVAVSQAPPLPDYTPDEDAVAEAYWKDRIDPRSSIHVLYSHGCSIKVHRGELVTYDSGQERRFAKVLHGLKALILIGQSGSITLDAIRWCEAQGIAICLLDWYGELISVTRSALKTDVSIRRAQFTADPLKMARAILIQKTQSQARLGKISQKTYRTALSELKTVKTVDELVKIEGRIALEYWANWSFGLKHKKRNWPDHWTQFHYRASPISGGPRHAMHPANAILNYAYSVVAAQVTRALQASGFDSAVGYLHADAEGRHSLTYDVMELLRAEIDNAILPWVASQTWKRPDFPVTPEGIVRLQPTLAAVVAQRALLRQQDLNQATEWLVEQIAQ